MSGPATVILKGSPAIQSNSMRLTRTVLESVGGSNTVVDLYRERIQPCVACGRCGQGEACPIDDAVPDILRCLGASDLVILATPVHFMGPSAPVAALFGRFQPAWMAWQRGEDFLPPRPRQAGLVVTAGADHQDLFKPTRTIAGAAFRALGIPILGMATAINTDTLPIMENPVAQEEARDLGMKIKTIFRATGVYRKD